MRKLFLIFIVNLVTFSFVYSQGTIRGKVTDENGETMIGVTILLKMDRTVGTITDFDGNYSLKISQATPQVLIVSYISYQTIEAVVNPLNNEIIIKNFALTSSINVLGEVEVVAKQARDKAYYMENIKKNSATTIDYVSNESMKRTGDNNITAAVARVSGVSTNGGFITVRGIGDRYVKTTINGSRIPTLDPFTNNIKLDLFPASLVDNVIITKTASPDLPGDWAGAYLSVETKDYPEKLSVNVETAFGYNNQSTFKDVVSSQRSSTDWQGYDNNFRDRDHNNFVGANMNPTQYEELIALGLGNYYNSLGVNSQNWGEGTSTGEMYFKLGLVQLGLLSPALINDLAAYTAAKNAYLNGSYKQDAFNKINANVGASGKSFPSNWNTTKRKAPLAFSQSFSIGNQTKLFKRDFGFIIGFRYGNSTIYDAQSTSQRANFDKTLSSSLEQEVSRETNGWSALMNISYKLNDKNSISLLFMPNFTGVNNVRNAIDKNDSTEFVITKSQFYEQRKQMIYQFKSEHYFTTSKLKLELNASYTRGKSSAPDFKNLTYLKDAQTDAYLIGGIIGDGIHRFYRYLSDNIFDSRISAELPINNSASKLTRKLKFGGAYQRNDRKSDQYDYAINNGPFATLHPLTNNDIDQYFSIDRFDISNGFDAFGHQYSTIDYYYSRSNSAADHTFGSSNISAGYLLLDYTIIPSLRIVGGVRVEKAKIFTDVFKYDSLGYAANDSRRDYSFGAYPLSNPGKLNELSYLPSANIIYKLKDNESARLNLRLNFSQTVARPSIRELSDVANFDYEFRASIFGNSDLKMAQINNYDFRAESFFKNGDNISLSLFYKDFKNHIELINSGTITWENVDKSKVTGIELEGRKAITKHFEFRANITLVNSKTTFIRKRLEIQPGGFKKYIPEGEVTRPMFGQAPYIINGIIGYTSDSLGLTATISYNVQGPRLVVATNVKEIPDVYELARNMLDFKISKKLGNFFSVSFTVKDILNSPIRRAYNYEEGWTIDYDKYRYGTNYILGVLFKF